MVRLLQKDRLKFYIIFIIASAFCVIFLTGKKAPDNDMISCLTSANFICLILNNLYIYYIYTRALKIKSIYDKLIVRIGQKNFFNKYVLNVIIDICIYFLIVIISIYLKLGINLDYINILILYLILNFSNFFLQELISMLIFLHPKGNKYISIPIFMNFGFHYFLIPFIVNGILKM